MKLKMLLFTVLLVTALMGVMTVDVRSETTMFYIDHDPPEVPPNPNIVDPTLQSGFSFNITVNVANVIDLFNYGFDLNWTGSMLNVTNVYEGPFLKSGGSTIFIPQMNNTDNFVSVSCTLFFAPIGVTGNGTLAIIEFLVEDYGSTDLQLYNTLLKNSIGISLGHSIVSGYFRNTGLGDVNADHIVDIFDIGGISAHWYPGPPIGPLGYGKDSDINLDGSVDIFDIGITSANWGNTYP